MVALLALVAPKQDVPAEPDVLIQAEQVELQPVDQVIDAEALDADPTISI